METGSKEVTLTMGEFWPLVQGLNNAQRTAQMVSEAEGESGSDNLIDPETDLHQITFTKRGVGENINLGTFRYYKKPLGKSGRFSRLFIVPENMIDKIPVKQPKKLADPITSKVMLFCDQAKEIAIHISKSKGDHSGLAKPLSNAVVTVNKIIQQIKR